MGTRVLGPGATASSEPEKPELSRQEAIRNYFQGLDPRQLAGRASPFPLTLLALIGFLDAIEGGGGILYPEMIRDFHIQLETLVALNSVVIGTPVVLSGLLGGYVADRVNRVWL